MEEKKIKMQKSVNLNLGKAVNQSSGLSKLTSALNQIKSLKKPSSKRVIDKVMDEDDLF